MLSLRADGTDDDYEFYAYQPSMAAAVIYTVLFGLATTTHLFQMFRSKTWFMIPFIVGGCFETVGYIGRALSASENPGPYSLGPYIIQTLFILIAPALLAASIYMELGRIVRMIDGEHCLFIRRTWLTKIFVGGDVLSFLAQSAGGSLLASGSGSSITTGKNIVIAGLFIQIVFFGLFVVAAVAFHLRVRRAPTKKSVELGWWTKHMLALYIVSLLIFVRSIVRLVQYLQGNVGYITTHEVFLYAVDGFVMLVAMGSMSWIHPAEVARELRAQRDGKGGGGEMETV